MSWLERVCLVIGCCVSASFVGHFVLYQWARLFSKKLGEDPSSARELIESRPIAVRVYQYACSFERKTAIHQIRTMYLAALWVPPWAIFLLLVSTFFGLDGVYFQAKGYWQRWQYSRMTPERKRERRFEVEKKLLEMASEVRLNPTYTESNHPLHRAYRDQMLTGEKIALRLREEREAEEGDVAR